MAKNHERQELYNEILNNFNNNLDNLHQDNDILKMCINCALLSIDCHEINLVYGLPVLSNDEEQVLILPVIDGVLFQTVAPKGNYYDYKESDVIDFFLFSNRFDERVCSIYKFEISSSPNTYHNEACFHGRELSYRANKYYITDA